MMIFLVLLLSCSPPGPASSGESARDCADGEVLDGDVCVPAACGTGTWGNIGNADLFVDAESAEGGDGSQNAPLQRIQLALDMAGGGIVAVAAGTYPEVIEITEEHDGVSVIGRCSEMVVVDGSGGGMDDPTIYFHGARRSEWVMKSMTVIGGRYAGIVIDDGGQLSMDEVLVSGNTNGGLAAIGGDVTVIVTDSQFVDTQPNADGSGGGGIYAVGATLELTDGLVQGNYAAGIVASGRGTLVTLNRTQVLDTVLESRVNGGGLIALDGASVHATDCTIKGNRLVGVLATNTGTEVTLDRTSVVDTDVGLDGFGGTGISVQDGARLTATDCIVQANHESGVAVQEAGSEATLLRSAVLDTLGTSDGLGGVGLGSSLGGTIIATECTVERNHAFGVQVDGEGSSAVLDGTNIRNTEPEADGLQGGGISVTNGGTLTAVQGTIEGNHTFGVVVSDSGSSAFLEGVAILDTAPDRRPQSGRGLTAQFGAIVVAVDCNIQYNHNVGVLVDGEDTQVSLLNTSVLDTQPDEDGGGGRGIAVQNGASLEATSCTIQDNYESGVLVDTSAVTITDSLIRGTLRDWASEASIGLTAQIGATVTVLRTTIEDTEGPGIDVMVGSTLTCVDCTITNNQFAGAVLHGGSLHITESIVSDNIESPADGGGVGVFVYQDAGAPIDERDLTVEGTVIGAHPYAGIWIAAPGTYLIERSTLESGPGVALSEWLSLHGNAVYAKDVEVTLNDNTFTGASQATILLNGSAATLSGNLWTGSTDGEASWDIIQQFCAAVSPLSDTDQAPHSRICTADPELMVQELNFAIYFDEVEAY